MRLLRLLPAFALATALGAQGRAASLTPAQRSAWAGLLRAADARLAEDTLAVDRALRAGDRGLRRVALRTVGQLRMTARYPLLRTALADADTGAAAEAAFALGLARDSLACAPLQEALRRGGGVGLEAAWSLGELGSRCMPVDAMLAAASDDEVRVRVLEVAGRTRAVPAAPLLAAARSASADVRWGALYALARGRRREGAVVALGALRDTSDRVREQAARLLAKPLVDDSVASFAITALGEFLEAPQPHVRIAAARALATWGADVREPLLQRLGVGGALDPDANVRVAIAEALDTSVVRAVAEWRAAWAADTTFMVRRALLGGAIAGGVTLPEIGAWSADRDWRRRAAVAGWSSRGGDSALVRLALPALLLDKDARVRTAAAQALAAHVDSGSVRDHPSWRHYLAAEASRDPDVHVRATALGALVRSASGADVPSALDAYASASADAEHDARLAALRLIAAAWRRDSAGVRAEDRARIAALPVPDDLLLREAVEALPLLVAWRSAPHRVRPVAHYAAIVRRFVEPARGGRPATMVLDTERGIVRVRLACDDVPLTCAVFDSLAGARFWHGGRFHRVVPAFVAQDGDPRGDGNGGPGFAIRDELNRRRYRRGAVGMALSGPDTGGSQYFVTLAPQPHLDGRYTVIGTVVAGEAVMDSLVQGDILRELRVVR